MDKKFPLNNPIPKNSFLGIKFAIQAFRISNEEEARNYFKSQFYISDIQVNYIKSNSNSYKDVELKIIVPDLYFFARINKLRKAIKKFYELVPYTTTVRVYLNDMYIRR